MIYARDSEYLVPSKPMPPTPDPEAVAMLARLRGDGVLGAVAAAVGWLDENLAVALARVGVNLSWGEFGRVAADQLARRRVLESAWHALAAELSVDRPPPFRPTPAADTVAAVTRIPGGRSSIESALDEVGADLAGIQARVDSIRDLLATARLEAVGTVAPLYDLHALVVRRRELAARQVVLTEAAAAAAKHQGALVAAAIAAAGGRQAVAEGLASVAAVAPDPSDPLVAELTQAETEAAAKRAQLERLEGDKATAGGTLATTLRAALASLRHAADAVGARLRGRRHALANAVVDQALAGSEPARQALASAAVACPDAFAGGFADAVAAARWEDHYVAELRALVPVRPTQPTSK